MESILTVSGLTQTLKIQGQAPKKVLHDINFQLPRDSLTGFIGVNGAGKTTTLKSILNFIIPEQGQVSFFGQEGLSSESKVKLGFLPERPYFYDYLTGKEFLALHWELRGFKCNAEFNQRVDEVLTEVNLMRGKDLKLRQYSKGMLQRIGIAQAIIHRPQFLILDEPMSGLDPDGRYLVKQIIKNLHRLGTTIFFSSHLLQDMEELCDRLVIIDQGRIIYEGSLATLWSKHSEQFQIDFQETSEGPRQTWSGPQGEVQKQIDELRERKAHILRVFEKRISLEEAFVSLRKIGG